MNREKFKLTAFIVAFSMLALILLISATTRQQPQTFTFKFTQLQVQQLYFSLDKSEAPHSMVSMLQAEINKQYSEQVKKDSTQNKK